MKGFYSPIERLLEQSTRGKGTGAEFMTELSKQPGYKQAEVEDRDLQALMALPKMAREEFMAQLKAKPGAVPREQVLGKQDDETHHEEYTLPGGENYREILLQHPKDKFPGVEAHFGGAPNVLASIRVKDRVIPGEMGYTLRNKRSGFKGQHYGTEEEAQAAIQGYSENLRPMLGVVPSQGPAKKVLHIEEIQSDWHQQGREKGYAPKGVDLKEQARRAKFKHTMASDQLKEAKERSASIDRDLASDAPLFQDPVVRERLAKAQVEYNNKIMDLMPEVMKAEEAHRAAEQQAKQAIPDAPFKKNWHELALKRMIQHAAENGYDSIAITPGEEQAKRYGLSKHIDNLYSGNNGDGTWTLGGTQNGRNVFSEDKIPQEKLAEYVGKDAANKIIASGEGTKLSGVDLNVGGEGMKGFYDKMVPKFLNQFGKKYGAQVQSGAVPIVSTPAQHHGLTESQFQAQPPEEQQRMVRQHAYAHEGAKTTVPVHSFPITPEMRQDVLKNGIPMYAEGGAVDNKAKFLEGSHTQQRLYHGTTATEGGKKQEAIRSLKPSKEGALGSGVYLTPDEKFASSYAEQAGGNMLPVYARLTNPLILRGSGRPDKYKDPMIEALELLGVGTDKASKMVEKAYEDRGYIGKQVQTRAQAAGHDGLVQYDRHGNLIEVVHYNPRMIKSATGNRGTYDTSSPELSKAKGGAVSRETIKPVAHGIIKERVTVSPNMDAMQYELLSAKHFTKKVK